MRVIIKKNVIYHIIIDIIGYVFHHALESKIYRNKKDETCATTMNNNNALILAHNNIILTFKNNFLSLFDSCYIPTNLVFYMTRFVIVINNFPISMTNKQVNKLITRIERKRNMVAHSFIV